MGFWLGVTGIVSSGWGSNRLPWNAAGFSSVMFSSLSLGVECCVSVVVVLYCVSCCCGSSIGCCGGSVWECVCVVLGVSGAWAGGGAGVPSRCFLWCSEEAVMVVSVFAVSLLVLVI